MQDPRAFAAAFERHLPDLLALTERVVNIDSGSYMAEGVNRVEDAIGETLAALGFAIERAPLPGRGDQFTARLKLGNGPRLLILGHADTVWPAITHEWPFSRSGDRITGPGVGDMKSCVVMAVFALRILQEMGALAGLGSVTYLIVPDEEIGSPQSRGWIEAEARNADACLTLEPCRPKGGIVIGRGAVGAVYIEATGVSAHCGARPEDGASALSALASLVGPLEALTDPDKSLYASVGILRSGAARQVVPPSGEMHLDLRAPDADNAERMLQQVREIVSRPPRDRRVSVTMRGGFTRPAFPTHEGTKRLYSLAERICARLDAPIHAVVSRGGSDGSFAAGLGVPTLDGLGPICHDSCSRRETVEVSSIAQRGALFASLIAEIAAGRAKL
ncbi:MAG: M20/M25/M40 family metallo-hydrolase [Alphaproteobacteria bacterium]|nr:M20/M25/M40 family metallo-hydrolase [Alphaproteobacteria bacterium]